MEREFGHHGFPASARCEAFASKGPQECVHWSRTEHAFPSFPWGFTVPSHQAAVSRGVPVFETPYPYVYLNEGFRAATKSRGLCWPFPRNRRNRSSIAVTKVHSMGHGSTHFLLASPFISCHNWSTARREARRFSPMEGRSTWMFWFLTSTTSNSVGQRAAAAHGFTSAWAARGVSGL